MGPGGEQLRRIGGAGPLIGHAAICGRRAPGGRGVIGADKAPGGVEDAVVFDVLGTVGGGQLAFMPGADEEQLVSEGHVGPTREADAAEAFALLVDLPTGGGLVGRDHAVEGGDLMDPPLVIDFFGLAAEIGGVEELHFIVKSVLGGDDGNGSAEALVAEADDVEGHRAVDLGVVVFDHGEVVILSGWFQQGLWIRDQCGADAEALEGGKFRGGFRLSEGVPGAGGEVELDFIVG